MLIYPAIDIKDGRCVRLRQGVFDRQTVYAESPSDVAQQYANADFRHVHIVDLDGARAGRPVNIDVIRQIVSIPTLRVQVGGGIRAFEAVEQLLDAGAERVILGSIALEREDEVRAWMLRVGPERIAFAVDLRDGLLASNGWDRTTSVSADDFIRRYIDAGGSRFICTDISRDGMMTGPAFNLYDRLLQQFPSIQLVASGGVSSLADIEQLLALGVFGTIVGTALYDGSINLASLKQWDADEGR